MTLDDSATEKLIDLARQGDREARDQLLAVHRERLKKMVALRMDRRLSARVSPSDVVQDALAEASLHLTDYLQCRPLPFYPWLRRLAWERVVAMSRQHIQAGRRSIIREEPRAVAYDDGSVLQLVDRLASNQSNPSTKAIREELRVRVQQALAELDPQDHEILVLRFLEQLSTRETAAVLEMSESAIKSRLMRALTRLRSRLDERKKGRPS